jgi:hypothetical protein
MDSSYNNDEVISNMPSSTTTAPDNSAISWIKWFFFNRYMLILLILSFLGINLFSYLDSGLKAIVALLRPLLAVFGYTFGETAKETVKIAKKGTQGVIGVTADTLTGGINILEKGLTGKKGKGINRNGINRNGINGNGINGNGINGNGIKKHKSSFPIPDDAGSRTQANKAKSNTGYCYIGEDRGFRNCIQVNDTDTCMSGEIFPSQEICINPTLRQ